MRRTFYTWLLLTSLLGPLSLQAQEQMIVLRNGRVLRGVATQTGDRYRIQMGEAQQSEVVLPTQDVEIVCNTLEEAYQFKRSQVRNRDVSAHIALGDWCIRQGLVSQAADQVLAVKQIEPRNPRAAQLERRLDALLQTRHRPAVEPVAAIQPVSVQVDDVLEALPEGSLERFASTVQPILSSRCAGTSCHGVAGTSTYRLIRPRYGEVLPSRVMRRNAFATLEYLNRETPDASPLLTIVQQPHGNTGPLLSPADAQYAKLLDWAHWIARRDSRPTAADFRRDREVRSAAVNGLPNSPEGSDPFTPPLNQTLPPRPAVPATPAATPPTDPFDPEQFNRMP